MANMFMAVVGAVTTAALLSACSEPGGAADSGEPSVVAGFYPYAFVAERIAGEHAGVTNLTPPGAEPHDLELSPQQVALVTDADVMVYHSGFQPAVDDAVEQNTEGVQVEVTRIAPLELAGDPHIWQDPTRLAAVATALADALARADPEHADDFRDNARDLVADLQALDREFRQTLQRCERRAFVTSHAAFGYLANRYDLEMIPIRGLSPDTEPSPSRLAELAALVRERGVTTIFTETLVSAETAQTLAGEVGVEVTVLDPIEGLSDTTADEDYLSLMRANLATLAEANECS